MKNYLNASFNFFGAIRQVVKERCERALNRLGRRSRVLVAFQRRLGFELGKLFLMGELQGLELRVYCSDFSGRCARPARSRSLVDRVCLDRGEAVFEGLLFGDRVDVGPCRSDFR